MKKGSALRTLRFIFITVVLFVLSFSAAVVTVLNVYVPQYIAKIDGEQVGYFTSPAEFDEVYEKIVDEKEADGLEVKVYLPAEPEFELTYVVDSVTEEQNLYTNMRAFVKTEYTTYNVNVKGKTELTFATEKEAEDYAKKIKNAVKSTVKSTVKVQKSTSEELVSTTTKASAKKIYDNVVSRYKPVVRTYSPTYWVSSGRTKYGNKASGALHSFIAGGVRPTSGVVTQNYGRSSYYASGMHTGIDIASKGSKYVPIYAYKAGTVVNAGWNGDYGKCIIISHGKDANGNELQTLYAHCSSINVVKGQTVAMGQQIANMGTTGRSTGVHLHFEIRVLGGGNKTFYNPAYYI
ncbi:MAG: M23 family metallopeptidase [Clostridia bacterium]|nr:M23 family metallopeptidase [Clostridia bacterium]